MVESAERSPPSSRTASGDGATGGDSSLAYILAVAALTVFATVQHLAFENAAQSEIEDALEESHHDELEPVSVTTEYASRGVFDERQIVTVHVAKPTDSEYPGLENELRDRIAAETDEEVIAENQFVDDQRSGGERPDDNEITNG